MSNADLLHNLRTAASLVATASTGAEKKSARAERDAAIVAAAAGGIKPAEAIEAAGIKNVSSYYDILRAAKAKGVTAAAKAKKVEVEGVGTLHISQAAPKAKAKENPYTGKAILASAVAAAKEKGLEDEPRFASTPITRQAIQEAKQLPKGKRFQVRYRDEENVDRKKTVIAPDEAAAHKIAVEQYDARRVTSITAK